MSLRLRKRKAKRREEYLLNRDYELESSRVRYDADAEQRWASARDMYVYRANLESNRASKRWQQEKNSVAMRASKKLRYELNSRASKRESLAREFRLNKWNSCKCNITVNIVLLGNKRTTAGFYRTIVFSYFYIVLHVYLYTSSHLFKKMNETRYKKHSL